MKTLLTIAMTMTLAAPAFAASRPNCNMTSQQKMQARQLGQAALASELLPSIKDVSESIVVAMQTVSIDQKGLLTFQTQDGTPFELVSKSEATGEDGYSVSAQPVYDVERNIVGCNVQLDPTWAHYLWNTSSGSALISYMRAEGGLIADTELPAQPLFSF